MLTLTGNGRLTRDVHLRTTHSGKTVATISVASDRRDRDAPAVYVDLIVWEAQAHAAATHLIKGQAVRFSGRFEPRDYVTATGDQRIALELHSVELEYGAKPHAAGNAAAREPSAHRRRQRRRHPLLARSQGRVAGRAARPAPPHTRKATRPTCPAHRAPTSRRDPRQTYY